MSVLLSLVARQARLTALRDVIDAGGGKMRFYTGSAPATPETASAETLLATVPLAAPSGSIGASGAVATLTLTPAAALAGVAGIVGWVRVANGAGNGVMDLSVGLAGSGLPVIMSDVQVYAGGEVQVVSCVIAE